MRLDEPGQSAPPGHERPTGLQQLAVEGAVAWHRGRRAGADVLVGVLGDAPAGDAVRQRLAAEAATIRGLHDEHLLPCLELYADGPRHVLVHPWPDGPSLSELCAAPPGRSTGERLRTLHRLIGLVSGLEAIHAAGLAHHGLLPERLFLIDHGIRIAGLGLSASGTPPRPGPAHAMLAPELVLGLDADIRADLHAVGALLMRLMDGRWPWTVNSAADLDAWARAELPAGDLLSEAASDDGLESVLRATLARRPQERYATPGDLRDDLELVLAGFAPAHARALRQPAPAAVQAPGMATLDQPLRPPRPVAAKRSTLPLIVGAVAGVVVLGGLGVWMMSGRGEPAAPVAAPGEVKPATTIPAERAPQAPATAASRPAAAPQDPAGGAPRWAARSGRDAYGEWAELAVGPLVQRLRRLTAGEGWQGSPADEPGRAADEERFRSRLTTGLWLADSETTQRLYQEVMGANPSRFKGDDLPVDNVSWTDASLFCQRLAQRLTEATVHLPSEAWWERACRAGGEGAFAEVDGKPQALWDTDSAQAAPHPVKQLAPNAWGLFDMHGNALEWTADAMAPYPTEPTTDHQVWRGAQRVARGGSWNAQRSDCRAAIRYHLMAPAHFSHLGFRFAIDE